MFHLSISKVVSLNFPNSPKMNHFNELFIVLEELLIPCNNSGYYGCLSYNNSFIDLKLPSFSGAYVEFNQLNFL